MLGWVTTQVEMMITLWDGVYLLNQFKPIKQIVHALPEDMSRK